MNRLSLALYAKPSTSVSASFPTNSYDEFVSYDKNGNIRSVFRTGDLDSALDIFTIDNLTYTYDAGNRLMKVDDSTNHPQGFTDGNAGNDYAYDDFGNLVQDLNKGIYKSGNKGITYNHLNLPKEITFQNNPNKKITYLYNALGQKLEKKVTNGSTIITTDYQGGFQYEDEVLRFFATSEGYVSYDEQSEVFTYIYNYTDHLGNIRLSYMEGAREEDPPAIVEENHYYPFGLKHTNYGFVPQQELAYKYKYNHQEFQDELDLNVYAMDWRQYDPAIARWVVHDPVIHHSMSPYNAFDNNPVFWADPSGGNAIHSSFANLFSWENRFHYNLDTGSYFMFGQEISHSSAMNIIESIASYTNHAFNITSEGGSGGGGSTSGGSLYNFVNSTGIAGIVPPGYMIFYNLTPEQFKDFAVIPEDGNKLIYPTENGFRYEGDGFFYKCFTNDKYWYKVSAEGIATITMINGEIRVNGFESPIWKGIANLFGEFYHVGWLSINSPHQHHIPNPFNQK